MIDAIDDITSLPPRTFVCERLELSPGNLTLLCASGHSGKTLFCQYLAACVSTGSPVFGSFPVRQGRVIHCDFEQNANLTTLRYFRIGRGLGVSRLNGIERKLMASKFDGCPAALARAKQDLIEKCAGASMIIIDSLKKISSVDENSSEVEGVVDMLRSVAETTNAAIVLVHHKGKGRDAKQSGRGHSSIYDSVDCQIDLDARGDCYTLTNTKNRNGRLFAGVKYTMADTGTLVAAQRCTEALRFELLEAEIANPVASRQDTILHALGSGTLNQGGIFALVKGDRATFRADLEAMVADGRLLASKGRGTSILYSAAGAVQ